MQTCKQNCHTYPNIRTNRYMTNSTPSYKTRDPRGWGGDPTRGAALGRPTVTDKDRDADVKLHLRREYLNQGGYDRNGTYFGIGRPLYWCADEDLEIDFMLRADTREEAKAKVRERYPNARFFR